MAEIYGHKWVSSYGESDANDTWSMGLADITNDELKRGFFCCLTEQNLNDNGEDWPPTLKQFRAMCRPPKRINESMYRIDPTRALPHKRSREEIANGKNHIAALKARVRGR